MATEVADSVVSASRAVRWGLLPSRVARPVSRTSDVVRNDLLASLASSPAPIVSVIAPGGYGKSTLVAQFAEHGPRPSAWLSVEEDADDPVTLARYLVFALGRVTSVGEDLLHELDGLHPRMRIATAGLAAAIAGVDAPIVLVVDDVHRLTDHAASPCCARSLGKSPRDPRSCSPPGPRRLSRWRVFGPRASCSSSGSTTCGSASTTQPICCELRAPAMSAHEDVARLTDQTEGWAVGLYLAARSMAADPASGPTFGGDDRSVADYLRETMIADLPAPEVEFLIQSSVLEELSGPLCDATLATTGSGAMLESIESSNLLVVPLDRRRDRYRYHHLFRDLLRMELEHRAPELVPELTARASAWCEAEGLTDQAVAYAIAGHHVDRVGELIAHHGQATYLAGRASVLRAWCEWFGTHGELDHFPAVAVIGAWFYVAEQLPLEAERWIDAIPAAGVTDAADRDKEAVRALLLATMGRNGVGGMRADAERAISLLPVDSPWRPNASLLTGLGHLCAGELEPASRAFGIAVELAGRDGGPDRVGARACGARDRRTGARRRGRCGDARVLCEAHRGGG